VSVSRTLLGLLEAEPQHGYTLRRRYDEWFGTARPLKSAQVYSTLQRLARDGLVDLTGIEGGGGPERHVYTITGPGVDELERWLEEPEVPDMSMSRRALFAKVVIALASGRPAEHLLHNQRQSHLSRMRELRAARQRGDLLTQLAADFESHHLNADLQWMDAADARLAQLGEALRGIDGVDR
jgi:DNA-binding PadR family transcriptional regulator